MSPSVRPTKCSLCLLSNDKLTEAKVETKPMEIIVIVFYIVPSEKRNVLFFHGKRLRLKMHYYYIVFNFF